MSAKKDLKQTRLPFQILTSPKGAVAAPTAPALAISPKTPQTATPVVSRKRKPSSDGENLRSTKIGRTNSKENIIAEQDPVELIISDDSSVEQEPASSRDDASERKKKAEITPTAPENSVRIKLPSRRKQCFDVKPQKSNEGLAIIDPDESSVVFLDEEVLPPKKAKKSARKSEKKDKPSSGSKPTQARKSLRLNESIQDEKDNGEDLEVMEIEDDACESFGTEGKKSTTIKDQLEKCLKDKKADSVSAEISELVETTSPNEDIHDQIMDLLSDDAKPPNEKKSPSNDVSSGEKSASKLTPKALARRKELEVKRIEKEQQRQKEREEKEKQRQQEKQMREDAKKKEKEEKEELRKREKEEREKKKQAELEKKEEEKKRLAEQKEEEKRAKEEEKRQKEEEKKRQLDARDEEKKKKEMDKLKEEERKKKAAEVFSKFFVQKKKSEMPCIDDEISKDSAESAESAGHFMPFQIRGKMRLAPCVRLHISKRQLDKLDEYIKNHSGTESYLKDLKNGKVPKKSGKTWPEEDKDDEVVLVDELEGVGEDIISQDDDNLKHKHRAKLLLFNENRRPAFYGTWRKKSLKITGRRPFHRDNRFFDYEIDSDEEWEEEEPGESLHGSDSEKEKETYDDNYELDNDFFVPHGHLSEEEMREMDDEMVDNNTPEVQKAKLKILHQEFAAEMKKPTEKIKPRLIGCIWLNGDEDENGCSIIGNYEKKYHCSDIIWRILKAREMMCSDEEITMQEFEPELAHPDEESEEKSVKTPAQKKAPLKIDDDSVKEFIKLIHGNTNNKKFIVREFQAYRLKNYHNQPSFQEFSVKSVEEKMTEVSDYKTCPDEGLLFGKKCWYVKADILKQYFGDEKLMLPNQWTYILEKKTKQVSSSSNNDGERSKKDSREVSPEERVVAVKVNETVTEKADEVPQPQCVTLKAKSKDSPATPVSTSRLLKPKESSSSAAAALFKPKTPTSVATNACKQKETPIASSQSMNRTNTLNSGKKRVPLLMSVERGQSINEEKKNTLISHFLKTNQKNNQKEEHASTLKVDNNDVILID